MEVENSDSEMESKLNLTDLRFYMLLTPTVAIGFSFFGGQIRTLELSFFLTLILWLKKLKGVGGLSIQAQL